MDRDEATGPFVTLSRRSAKRTARELESQCPDVGEPLDYSDCLLLGAWRRLDAGERILPRSAMRLLNERVRERGTPSPRERSPERWVDDDEVSALLGGLFLLRIAAFSGASQLDDERLEEELLVGEGLTLALLLPRVYYAGDKLLAFIDRASAASKRVQATR